MLKKIVNLLDIQPLHHPIRTVLVYLVFEHTEQTRALLDQVQPSITPETEPVWKKI